MNRLLLPTAAIVGGSVLYLRYRYGRWEPAFKTRPPKDDEREQPPSPKDEHEQPRAADSSCAQDVHLPISEPLPAKNWVHHSSETISSPTMENEASVDLAGRLMCLLILSVCCFLLFLCVKITRTKRAELAIRKARLANREAQLNDHEAELAELEVQLNDRQTEQDNRDDQLNDHKADLTELERKLAVREAQLDNRYDQQTNRQVEQDNHDHQLNDLQAELDEVERKLNVRETQLRILEREGEEDSHPSKQEALPSEQDAVAGDQNVLLNEEELQRIPDEFESLSRKRKSEETRLSAEHGDTEEYIGPSEPTEAQILNRERRTNSRKRRKKTERLLEKTLADGTFERRWENLSLHAVKNRMHSLRRDQQNTGR